MGSSTNDSNAESSGVDSVATHDHHHNGSTSTSTAACHVNEGFEGSPDHPNELSLSVVQSHSGELLDECDTKPCSLSGSESDLKKATVPSADIPLTELTHNQNQMGANGSRRPSRVNFEDVGGQVSLVRRAKPRPKAAVIVKDAVKRYGNGPEVLNRFSMTVQKGTIYSLLGASGCGKTTLLSCVVGIKNLNSGEILVFGAKPGTKESGIPGKRVGLMPQDTALYNVFSIQEAMVYFGTIYGMTSSEINTSRDFLIDFLDLPDASRRIGTLSGGQKRRVSLAVSLIHSPELLILDEPTVGIDPLLRQSIWNHLCKLVSSQATTVIITTHYIEEARQSNMIGLMRGGRLLEEKSPENLLREYNTTLLEDIVLQICRKDRLGGGDGDGSTVAIEPPSYDDMKINDLENGDLEACEEPCSESTTEGSGGSGKRRMSMLTLDDDLEDPNSFSSTLNRLRALIRKNAVVMTRNLILLVFMILVPAIQIFIICVAIGNDPKPMRMGVVNYETNYTDCLKPRVNRGGCDVENLSCQFLSKVPPDKVYLYEYDNEKVAREAVENGKVWGFMTFPVGYSDNVYTRSASGNLVDNETLEGSQVYFEMDLSNKQIAGSLKKLFYDAYKDFVKELLTDCGFHPELGESPIKYLAPIYGKDDTDFREYVAPSILLGVVFFFPLCSSGVSYIWDKKQGTLERALVAGVRTWEIMAAFFVTEGIILLIQSGLSFSIITVLFGIQIQGSTLLAMSLTILLGLGGVSMGFLIASFCNEEIEAVMLAMASFFPNFLLAGMMWPLEGMPVAVQYMSYLLPCTLACESIRSIISRGWGFTHANVWPGFATAFAWLCFYWIVTIYIHKILLARK